MIFFSKHVYRLTLAGMSSQVWLPLQMISPFSLFENICIWSFSSLWTWRADERNFVVGNRESCWAITWKPTCTLKLKPQPSPWGEKNKLKRAVLFCFKEKNLKFQEWIIRENHSSALLLFPFLCSPWRDLDITENHGLFFLRLCNSNCGHSLTAATQTSKIGIWSRGFRNSWLGGLFSMNNIPNLHRKVILVGLKTIYKIFFPSNFDGI